jgi:uncharacterized membrane protein YfcA
METIGYLASALIGISLGLIGGGGSILTVPVLVYLFGVDAVLATSYSLFIVGSTSLVGAARNYMQQQVDVKTALLFGISSILTVFFTRKFIVPAIPSTLFTINGAAVTKQTLTLVLFALLMLSASISMIRSRKSEADNAVRSVSFSRLAMYGIMIGLVTGFLGAGGGFLLIPALVLLLNLPMKKAIGTSLLIIAMNSLIGFLGDIGNYEMNWPFLLTIASIAVAGIFIGTYLGKKIPGAKLKKGFGWFVLIMGVYILVKELYLK